MKKIEFKKLNFWKSKRPVINTAEVITTNNVALNLVNVGSQQNAQNSRSVETQTWIRNGFKAAKIAEKTLEKCKILGDKNELAINSTREKNDVNLKRDESFFVKFYDCPTYASADF